MATKRNNWFEVDKDGLGRVLARKGVEFAIGELIQNSWDADGVSCVTVTLEPVPHTPAARLVVEDDAPGGFADLAHAYRLFGGSTKSRDPTKRGKFDLGEKLVFALAREAIVTSTTGTIRFDARGRHLDRNEKRERGSRVEALLPMTREDLKRCEKLMRSLIPPVYTTFNGSLIAHRAYQRSVEANLETEIADEDGRLRKTWRTTAVHVHNPLSGEPGMLYEMGLPVQETGDAYHYNIQQRVPVGFDRDAVSAYYLNTVRSAVLNALAPEVATPEATWVTQAIEHGSTSNDVVKEIIRKRFGEKAVAFDPTDVEAVHRATAAGYTVVHGGSLSAGVWEKVRKAETLPRAGKIFPTHPENSSAADEIQPEQYTSGMRQVVHYAQRLGLALLDFEPIVRIVTHLNGNYLATWKDQGGILTFNLGQLGQAWFENGISDAVVELCVHEFGHHGPGCDNHLSDKYNSHLCQLAAKIRRLWHLDWEN